MKHRLEQDHEIYDIYDKRKHEGKETYVAFIDIEKAYDKVWSNSIFYLLWDQGIKGNLRKSKP